jgi:hypothetical protein
MLKNKTSRNKNRTRRNKNKTRRNKTEGGDRKNKKTRGGSRKAPSDWNKKVTELYRKMKKKDDSVMFKDALVRASELKKKGQL